MSSSAEIRVDEGCCTRFAQPCLAPQLTSVTLRGGLKISIVSPGSTQSISLNATGAYFLICMAEGAVVHSDDGPPRSKVHADVLHLFRHSSAYPNRRIELNTLTAPAAVVYFPATWCEGCPRGPGCTVARFLMLGAAENAHARDDEIEFDAQGRIHARALIQLSINDDADALVAEQVILALLSWVYARRVNRRDAVTADPDIPQRTLSKLRVAAEILSQRLDDPPTISEISALIGMNECDLKRCFKCVYGDGLASFSRNKRLAAARNLLVHSTLTVAEIALEVGYTNPSQFARAFRQHYDVNPSQYRSSPRKNRG